MANVVENYLRINGTKKDIKAVLKQCVNAWKNEEGEPMLFSFQTIIPRPESLNIESSSRVDDGIEYVKAKKEGKQEIREKYNSIFKDNAEEEFEKMVELGKIAVENEKKYGYKDWYDWGWDKWGTKWDCFNVNCYHDDNSVTISFETAWSTPMPVFKALSEQYPKLSIEVEYADQDDIGNNCGKIAFKGGKIVEVYEGDLKFACEMLGYDISEFQDMVG